jgi:uncharacterized membrane protein (UPF0127 family)
MFLWRGLAAAGAALALASAAQADQPRQNPASCHGQAELRPLQRLTIVTSHGPRRFMVELAGNPRQRELGLMCRRTLGPDHGMLFDFKAPQPQIAFWMRNTLIPLDMIFIRPDGYVLKVAHDVQPLDESPVSGGGLVLGVLELPAGRAAQLGIMPGDKVLHRMFRRYSADQ